MPMQAPRNRELKHTLQQAINWLQSYCMRYKTIPLPGISGNAHELLSFLRSRGEDGLRNRTGQSVAIPDILNALRIDEHELKMLYLQAADILEKQSGHLNPPFVNRLEEPDQRQLLLDFVAQGLEPTQSFIQSLPPYLVKDLATRVETFKDSATKKRKSR